MHYTLVKKNVPSARRMAGSNPLHVCPPSSISGTTRVSVLYTSILLQLPQRMVFPILLASLQRIQLAMELSAMSLTSQMNYVSFTAVQSNIIHGSICSISLQTKKVWSH